MRCHLKIISPLFRFVSPVTDLPLYVDLLICPGRPPNNSFKFPSPKCCIRLRKNCATDFKYS